MSRGRSLSTESGDSVDIHGFVDVAAIEEDKYDKYDMCAENSEDNPVLVRVEGEDEPVAGGSIQKGILEDAFRNSMEIEKYKAVNSLKDALSKLNEETDCSLINLRLNGGYILDDLTVDKFKENNETVKENDEIASDSVEIINNIIELRKNFNGPAYNQVEEKIKKLEADHATEDKNSIQYQSYKKYKKKVAVKGFCDAAKIALGATVGLALIGTVVAFAAAWPVSLTICGFAAVGFALGSFFGGKREKKSYEKSIPNHSYRRTSEYQLKKDVFNFAQCARKANEALKPKPSCFGLFSRKRIPEAAEPAVVGKTSLFGFGC